MCGLSPLLQKSKSINENLFYYIIYFITLLSIILSFFSLPVILLIANSVQSRIFEILFFVLFWHVPCF